MKKVTIIIIYYVLSCLLLNNAYSYSVSGTIYYWDHRSDRDANSKVTVATNQTNRTAWKPIISVFDIDGNCIDHYSNGCTEDDDDYIGTVTANESGYYTISGALYGDDIFLLTSYGNAAGQVKDNDDNYNYRYSLITYNITGDITKNWNITCYAVGSASCQSQDQVDDYYSEPEAWSNLIQIIGETEKYAGPFAVNGYNDPVIGYYPDYQSAYCNAGGGCLIGMNSFCVSDGTWNHIASHEMGHVLQKRYLRQSGQGSLSECTSSYDWGVSNAGEKCTTTEGFASFISGVANWDAGSSSPWYKLSTWTLEGDTTMGNGGNSKACISYYTSPYTMRGNLARFFWDLYDTTQNGSDDDIDDLSESVDTISQIWSEFPVGSSDRENDDEDHDAQNYDDGRNAWDYLYYDESNAYWWMLDTNCADGQTP